MNGQVSPHAEPGHEVHHAPRVAHGFLPGEEAEDGVEGARGKGAVGVTRHGLDDAEGVVDASEMAEARDEGIERALAREAWVEAREGSDDVVDGGGVGGGEEFEGAPGVEAAVLDALVEEVAERVEVARDAGGGDLIVVVGGGGVVGEGIGGGGGGLGGEVAEG